MIDSFQYDEFDSALFNIVGFVVNKLLWTLIVALRINWLIVVVAYS